MKFNLIILLGLITVQAEPTPKQCTTALFHGISTVMSTGMQKIQSLIMQGKIGSGYSFEPTCELVEIALNVITGEFYEQGCNWGMAEGAFEARVMSMLKKIINGNCPLFDRFTAQDATATCTPEDEIMAGFESVLLCVNPKIKSDYIANMKGFFEDSCLDARTVGPCAAGLVDACHNDDGQASDAIMNILAAMVANQLKIDLQFDTYYDGEESSTRSYVDQFSTCSEQDKGWLARLEGTDFDWTPDQANLPTDEELISAVNDGTVISFNNEYLREFGERIQREVYDKMEW